MIFRPQLQDFRIIAYYAGKIIIGISLFMTIPMAVALFLGETNPFIDFVISFLLCILIGLMLTLFCDTKLEPKWNHGMIIVSLSWVVAALVAAIPLLLSGHYASYLDACFEAMSGFTTTGLSLTQDLSHMAYAHQIWRHLLLFIGGQGMVVMVLTFMVRGAAGGFRLYVGEGRDEKVLPNIRHTAQFIWLVSVVYLVIGSLALMVAAKSGGLSWGKSLYHGVCIFMAAFDTGGFAPQAQNMMYYHNPAFEVVAMVIMIMGCFNFHLHYIVWSGKVKEIFKDVEMITLMVMVCVITVFICIGLSRMDVYHGVFSLFRKGFFQLISAHTTTGFQNIYSVQFINEWGSLSMLGIIFAMSLGGAVCSTTGGIKLLRCAIVAKAFSHDVKALMLPDKFVFHKKIHHFKDIVLNEKMMRNACMIVIAYVSVFFLGGLIGMTCGLPFIESFFESTSATANVGLSCGITTPDMPDILKMTYMFQMWAGRLEFMAVFALIGFLWAMVRGK